ncbi:MAG: type II toxin-antitoxin system PemK/MazF family toxin [Candidatus Woesearchaeota archaeon]
MIKIKRGDIILVNLDPAIGSEQGKTRPAVVIQNNTGNEFSPVTIVAPITSKVYSREFPTNVSVSAKDLGLKYDSTILLNQIRTIDKTRIKKRIKNLDLLLMEKVNLAIKVSLGLD